MVAARVTAPTPVDDDPTLDVPRLRFDGDQRMPRSTPVFRSDLAQPARSGADATASWAREPEVDLEVDLDFSAAGHQGNGAAPAAPRRRQPLRAR